MTKFANFRAYKMAKMAAFALLNATKLISRKGHCLNTRKFDGDLRLHRFISDVFCFQMLIGDSDLVKRFIGDFDFIRRFNDDDVYSIGPILLVKSLKSL